MSTGKAQLILAEFDLKNGLYTDFTSKLHSLISAILEEQQISLHSVTCRVKDRDKLAKKLSKPGNAYSCLEDITDIAGIRITTFFSDEVDKVAQLLEKEFNIDWANSIDKRAVIDPDRFGYLSLHHVVKLLDERSNLTEYRRFEGLKAEVQTRSILQHAWAEIEHDLGYKTALGVPNEIRRRFSRLAGLLELADAEFAAIRDVLNEYENTVSRRIETVPELVEINKASLESFMNNNDLVRRIDEAIARVCRGKIAEGGAKYVEFELPRLVLFEFGSIAELEKNISEQEATIIAFAEQWVSEPGLEFAKGVTLLYFEYLMVGKSGDDGFAKRFFETGVGLEEEHGALVNRVFETYRAISA